MDVLLCRIQDDKVRLGQRHARRRSKRVGSHTLAFAVPMSFALSLAVESLHSCCKGVDGSHLEFKSDLFLAPLH